MGYIPKSSSPNVTVNAIRLVLSGGVYVPPHVLSQGQGSPFDAVQAPPIILSDATGLSNSGVLKITSRQKDVLELLTLGKSNKEIAKVLGLKPGTIKMHTSRIFRLLGVSNRTEAVTTYAKYLYNYPKKWN
jgi:DNA-binding NarL/FixJ family response regulator